MTKQDTIFFANGVWRLFVEIRCRTLLPVSRYNGVTLCVDGDCNAVGLAIPVFAVACDFAVG